MADIDLHALTDLQTPWCVHVAATLRIAEHLQAGPATAADLAAAAKCDPYALGSMLTYLVGKGIFAEPEPGTFELNDNARALFAQARFLDLDGIGGRMAYAWSTLPRYVRTGRSAYDEVFGRPFWEDLEAHPAVGAEFDALMGIAGHGDPDPIFDLAGGWSGVRTVVDVGGGTGAMLAAVLRARPQVRGVLVDLLRTVERADFGDVADRASAVAQSFFDPLPAGADVYLLKKVLNDWPDEETVAILRRCAEAAAPSDGRVVVIGGVVPPGTSHPLGIEMVLVGSRTDTVAEFRELARRADLEVVATGHQPSGAFVVECRYQSASS
jgi:hypothetical protein